MADSITFADWHKPSLKSGDYTITVSQHVQAAGKVDDKFIPATQEFSVLGPRFTLDPQEVQDMFPPPGSLGEHSNVLPHIVFKRSTLPWERQAVPGKEDVPWLALLLFAEDEIGNENGVREFEFPKKLSELREKPQTGEDGWTFPDLGGLRWEKGDYGDDQVTVIDVNKSLLKRIIPTAKELSYLAHVRQSQGKEELAVLIGNRLPKKGGISVVHLVSLEHRYKGDEFDYGPSTSTVAIRFVSLKAWRFACVTAKQSFKGLLTHLNHHLLFRFPGDVAGRLIQELNAGKIPQDIRGAFAQNARPLAAGAKIHEFSQWRIADAGNRIYLVSNLLNVFNQAGKKISKLERPPGAQRLTEQQDIHTHFERARHKLDRQKATISWLQQPDHWWMEDRENQYFISQEGDALYVYDLDPDHSSTLRLPPLRSENNDANQVAEKYFKRGCVPLDHVMRQGNKSISWYHGPLTPGENQTAKEVVLPVRSTSQLARYNKDEGMFDVSYAAAWELGRMLTLQKTEVAIDLFNWKRAGAHNEHLKAAEDALAHLPNYESSEVDLELPQSVTTWFDHLSLLRGVPFSYLVPDEHMLPSESIRFFSVDFRWIRCMLDGAFSIGRVTSIDHERDDQHAPTIHRTGGPGQKPKIATGLLLRSDVVSGWPGLLVDGYDGDVLLDIKRIDRLSKNILLCIFAGAVTSVVIHQKPETLHFGFNAPDSSHPLPYKSETASVAWKTPDERVVNVEQLANALKLTNSDHSAKFAELMIEGVESVRFGKS